VRYDSLRRLSGGKLRILRPRVVLYTVLAVVGAVVFVVLAGHRQSFDAKLLRVGSSSFVIDGDELRNVFDLHLVNKNPTRQTFHVAVEESPELEAVIATPTVSLDPLAGAHISVILSLPSKRFEHDFALRLTVEREGSPEVAVASARFLGRAL
jgi:hypothetical protein